MIRLDENNYRLYAARNYSNACCLGEEEFKRDLALPTKIMSQIDRILADDPKGNIRLLVNQVVIFFNVFRPPAAQNLIFYLTKPEYWPSLKTILVVLQRSLEEDLPEIEYSDVIMSKLSLEFE